MIATWTLGLLRRRRGRLAADRRRRRRRGRAAGLPGRFLAAAQATMTARAVRSVAVDWQVEVQPGTDPVDRSGHRARPHRTSKRRCRSDSPIHRIRSPPTGGSTQTTGPAMVLGIPPNYREQFPGAIRTLVGADNGVLLAQQTAANLHAAPGDTIQHRAGRHRRRSTSSSTESSTFPRPTRCSRRSAHPPEPSRTAPPDNVLILAPSPVARRVRPAGRAAGPTWSAPRSTPPSTTRCRADPAAAYTQVSGAAHNLEARAAGGALRRRQPRRRPRRRPQRRRLRPGAVLVPRPARRRPGRPAHRDGRRRRRRPPTPRPGAAARPRRRHKRS